MHFEKISFEQWYSDISLINVDSLVVRKWYANIELPKQGTQHSMGIDFCLPYAVNISPHNKIKIPTGIRWVCDAPNDKHYCMLIVPRSSIGIKYGLQLQNTIGVIDSDYYLADNEGHIQLFFVNTSDETISLPQHKAIAQGLIIPYSAPDGTESDNKRHGGFGSTDDNKK